MIAMLLAASCVTTPDRGHVPVPGSMLRQGLPPGDGTRSERAYIDVRADTAVVARGRRVQLWRHAERWNLAAEVSLPNVVLDVAAAGADALVATRAGVFRLGADGARTDLDLPVGDDVVFLAGDAGAVAVVTPSGVTASGGARAAFADGQVPAEAWGAPDAVVVRFDDGTEGAWSLPGLAPLDAVPPRDASRAAVDDDGTVRLGDDVVPGRPAWVWVAGGGGRWCLGTGEGGRCFGDAPGAPLGPAWAVDLSGGEPMVLGLDGAIDAGGALRKLPRAATLAVAGSVVAVGGDEQVWILEGADEPAALSAGPGAVTSLAWSSTGERLAIATFGGSVHLLDLRARAIREIGSLGAPALSVAWESPDRLLVALDGAPVHRLDLAVPRPTWAPLDWHAVALAASPAGTIASAAPDGTVTIHRTARAVTLPPPVHARRLAWASDEIVAWIGDTAGGIDVSSLAWTQIGPGWLVFEGRSELR